MSAGSPSASFCAEIHHDQPVGEAHHEVHVVLDQQHRHALAPSAAAAAPRAPASRDSAARRPARRAAAAPDRRRARARSRRSAACRAAGCPPGRAECGASPTRAIARAASARVRASSARSSRSAAREHAGAAAQIRAERDVVEHASSAERASRAGTCAPMPRRAISNGTQPTIDSPRKTTSPEVSGERAGDEVEHRALAGAVRADQAEDLAAMRSRTTGR